MAMDGWINERERTGRIFNILRKLQIKYFCELSQHKNERKQLLEKVG